MGGEKYMKEPKLRFKADDGSDFPDWEECTVGELFVSVVKKNKDGSIQNVITNSAEYGLIPQRDFFDKDIAIKENTSNYTIIQNGDFVYNPRKSTTAPFGPFNIYERDEAGIVSPLYTCLTPKYKEMTPYLSWYFRTNKWHPYIVTHGAQSGARHDRVGMTATLMNGIPVIYPSLPEQQKIADFLSTIDTIIEKQRATVSAWEERKKGVMQKLFSQEVRFKADDGSDFPDWEEKRLGDVFEERTERSVGGEELLSVTISQGVIRQSDSDKRNNSSENKSNYKVVKKNDLAYNTMRMWQGAEGVSDFDGIVSPAYTVVTPLDGNNGKYFEIFFKQISMLHLFQRYSQGLTSDTWNLKFPSFAKIKCCVPCEKEQNKIVNCIVLLDTVIQKQKETLEKWQELKKGLLQQMFV